MRPKIVSSIRTAGASLGLVLLLGSLACDDEPAAEGESKSADPGTVEKVEGKVTVGGKEAKVLGCTTVSEPKGTALELRLDTGITVVMSQLDGVSWKKEGGEPARLECEKMSRSTQGGKTFVGAWTVGEIDLACEHPDGKIEAKLTVDCGVVNRPSNRK